MMIRLHILRIITVILAVTGILATTLERPGDECRRACVKGTPQFKCRYDFFVSERRRSNKISREKEKDSPGGTRHSLEINGESPGPVIEVCIGDAVEVVLHNRLPSEEVSLHWNGLRHLGSPHLDGVSMISQCPVMPFSSFQYDIKPEINGTYYYHAHTITQQGDGLFGALIIRDFDDHLAFEKVFIISAETSSPLSSFPHSIQPEPIALSINGKVDDHGFNVQGGRHYRFRIINANVLNCPVAIGVADHLLKVVAAGTSPIKSSEPAKRVIIFPGEKLDVVLETNQLAGRYVLALQGLHECRHLIHKTTLTYDHANTGTSYDNNSFLYLDAPEELQGHGCQNLGEDVVCSLDLKTPGNENIVYEAESIYYVPFDVNFYSSFSDDMTDYSFNIYGFTFYPSYLTTNANGVGIAQVNEMTFKYPPSPILSQPEAVPEDMVCSLEDRSAACDNSPQFCECLQILAVSPYQNVEVILINEGKRSNSSHVFHVHGYSVDVIAVNHFERPITRAEVVSMDQHGLLPRNLVDPPKMDTFVVPNKGYVIVRLYTENLGYWLWEARSTGVFPAANGPAMQFLMRVGFKEALPTVPIEFPTCGNHKGPDLIFESD